MKRDLCLPLSWHDDAARAADALLSTGLAALRCAVPVDTCAGWVTGTYEARARWTADFGGEQFSLGRAFYTHLEQAKSTAYFSGAAASDAVVETYATGLQEQMRALAARLTRGRVAPRRGWCGAGIHVFPAQGEVAERGGVVHFDTEGLTGHHVARRGRAVSVVCMLQPPAEEGGLRVWDVTYGGEDRAPKGLETRPSAMILYGMGDVIAFDSYRLHQIQPFAGDLDRISATLHLAEIDPGHWESWF